MCQHALSPALIADLVPLYLAHARVYYRRRDGSPTREHLNCGSVLSSFLRHVGPDQTLASVDRRTVRGWIDSLILEGLSRGYINVSLGRLRRFFKWCVEEYDLPAGVISELSCVRSLPAHRSSAHEPDPVEPARLDEVRAVLAYMPATARDVVELLMRTGARLSEVLEATNSDVQVDAHGARLCPRQHKCAHHGRRRVIPLMPEALAIIERHWRPLAPLDPLFPPAARGAGSGRGKRRSLSPDAIRAAIRRACERAGVEPWTPHQVRHAVAAVVRDRQGLDAASALLGHARVDMTEHYAPLSFEHARRAVEALRTSNDNEDLGRGRAA